MTYAGYDLSSLITIKKIRRTIGNVRDINKQNAPKIGTNITYVKTEGKIIEVDFSLASFDLTSIRFVSPDEPSNIVFGNINKLRERIAGIFHQDSVAQLSFSDEPDRYYKALVEDSVELEAIQTWYDEATVKFYIPDGTAHSSTYKMVRDYQDQGDKIVFEVTNDGTVDAYPIINVKHNSENGYIGLVNQQSAFEIGNREEADTEQVRQSEILFDYRDSKITAGLSAANKNVAILNDTMQTLRGTIGSVNWQGRLHLFLQSSGGTTGNNAGSLTWNIPADSTGVAGSLNDYIWWRQVFWLGAANQYGFIKLTVSDEQGRFLYGVETYKRHNGLGCEYNFMAADGKGGYKIIKKWTFKGTHENRHNPFNEPRGWSDLKRNDDKITVYWWGSYNTFTIPEIKGRKSAKIHVAFGALGNKPLVSRMYLDSIFYRKDFVSVTKDIPNRYPIGSNVVINSEDDTVYIDGIAKASEVVDGSKWPYLPPGTSQLEIYVSSFVRNKPTVTIGFEERWL